MTTATITWTSGPVLRARPAAGADGRFMLAEAVEVGARALLGEVVALERDSITVQVYEDTTGLRPGDAIQGSGALLRAPLGPGLLGGIFDGLLRPLAPAQSPSLASGRPSQRRARFAFRPRASPRERLGAGAHWGDARTTEAGDQRLHLPPGIEGDVVDIAAEGTYAEDESLLTLHAQDGRAHRVAMCEFWPVRTPRPVREHLSSAEPLVTGQRILDALFPLALGGKAAIPGGFGTGKTILLEALAKACSANVIVYLGCGERGNEIAGVLDEFPRLQDPRSGRPLSERTVVIANTSNMPVAAREASVYTAITVAEYFRDRGLHVALMADSTSRWAEALREVASRLGELPGEGGFPAYLASRIANFYERAGHVRTLAGATASVSLLGAISPPSGDFSEPVTSHTKRYARSFWALDAQRAQARFYPAVHPLQSYSEDAPELAVWWDGIFQTLGDRLREPGIAGSEWLELRRRFLSLLDEQAQLERMARIIGKDALPPRQQLALFCAEVFNDTFLRQSAFSDTDRYAGPARQAMMMRAVAHFIRRAHEALDSGARVEHIAAMTGLRGLLRMGEEVAEDQLAQIDDRMMRLDAEFDMLVPVPHPDAPQERGS